MHSQAILEYLVFKTFSIIRQQWMMASPCHFCFTLLWRLKTFPVQITVRFNEFLPLSLRSELNGEKGTEKV